MYAIQIETTSLATGKRAREIIVGSEARTRQHDVVTFWLVPGYDVASQVLASLNNLETKSR